MLLLGAFRVMAMFASPLKVYDLGSMLRLRR
jgi:hypothetical protein